VIVAGCFACVTSDPLIVKAEFTIHHVHASWHPWTDPHSEDILGDQREVMLELMNRPQRFDVAVIDVFFREPLYANRTIPLADVHRFLRLHRDHRQVLYGEFCPRSS